MFNGSKDPSKKQASATWKISKKLNSMQSGNKQKYYKWVKSLSANCKNYSAVMFGLKQFESAERQIKMYCDYGESNLIICNFVYQGLPLPQWLRFSDQGIVRPCHCCIWNAGDFVYLFSTSKHQLSQTLNKRHTCYIKANCIEIKSYWAETLLNVK